MPSAWGVRAYGFYLRVVLHNFADGASWLSHGGGCAAQLGFLRRVEGGQQVGELVLLLGGEAGGEQSVEVEDRVAVGAGDDVAREGRGGEHDAPILPGDQRKSGCLARMA
ncbi:hypothetical protein GCM10017559_08370 [Streptosporangium longisporum]|uniref:Uncharacterized protein n=1 Tax=Streptosporangium longisporum TaxID=46187 RepID=A0ABN3XTB7_9ACTN